jgi:hypothetical protein
MMEALLAFFDRRASRPNIFGCYQSVTDFRRGLWPTILSGLNPDESFLFFALRRRQCLQMPRPSGWNSRLTFAISPEAPAAVTPTKHLVTK